MLRLTALTFVCALGAAAYNDEDGVAMGFNRDVIVLTDATFAENVEGATIPWIVDFYAPWCGHCKKLMPEWATLATNLKGVAKAGSVDATQHKVVTNKYEVQGYPNIKLFLDGGKQVVTFKGTRDAKSIEAFVHKMLRPPIEDLKTSADLQAFVSKHQVAIILAGHPTDGALENVFKNASDFFQAETNFGRIHATPPTLQAGLVAYSDGEVREHITTATPEQLDTFIVDNNQPYVQELGMGSFFRATHSGRQCVVGVVDGGLEFMEASNGIKQELRVMAKTSAMAKAYRFGWIDGAAWPEFIEQIGLDPTAFPTIMVIDAPNKVHYVHRNASYSRTAFITEVEAGRVPMEGDGASILTRITDALGGPQSVMLLGGFLLVGLVMYLTSYDDPYHHRSKPGVAPRRPNKNFDKVD